MSVSHKFSTGIAAALTVISVSMKGLRGLDSKLSVVQMRIRDLVSERHRLEEAARRPNLRPENKDAIQQAIERIDAQIVVAEKEEAKVDNERYDLLWYRRR